MQNSCCPKKKNYCPLHITCVLLLIIMNWLLIELCALYFKITFFRERGTKPSKIIPMMHVMTNLIWHHVSKESLDVLCGESLGQKEEGQ